MVGEIRDRETAQMAIQSALTGHLVFSTLHTNDAPGAVSRLTEMGVEPFLTASAVTAVVSQRLARRLCHACRMPEELTEAEALARGLAPEVCRGGVRLQAPVGCRQCHGTGYRGRIGLYEVMAVTDVIRSLAMERASAAEIAQAARAEGMRSLREDGTDKVLQGITSLAELTRITA
jgi:type IV pilus assembly protein PilB